MSITFHCEYCGKKIEAPDTAGGKWGKCPGCYSKVYVPGESAEEELRLAPLDTDEERKQKELFAETVKLRQDIMNETDVPPEEGTMGRARGGPDEISEAEITTSVIAYLRQMADGELEEAEGTAKTIIPNASKAKKILERISLSELPEPELADIPRHVLAGLIKNLRSRFR